MKKFLELWRKRSLSHNDYVRYQMHRAGKTERLIRRFAQGRKLLDIGSHMGGYSIAFARKGYDVTGIEMNDSRLAAAGEMNRKYGTSIPFIKGDAMDIPFRDNGFDVALSSNIIEHLPDPERHIRECHRILKKGGILCIQFPPYWGLFGAHAYAKGISLPFQYMPRGMARWIAKSLGMFFELDEINKVTVGGVLRMAGNAGFSLNDIRGGFLAPDTLLKVPKLRELYPFCIMVFSKDSGDKTNTNSQ